MEFWKGLGHILHIVIVIIPVTKSDHSFVFYIPIWGQLNKATVAMFNTQNVATVATFKT